MATSLLHWNINRKIGKEKEISTLIKDKQIDADILLLVEAQNVDDRALQKMTGLKRLVPPEGSSESNLTPRFYSKLTIDQFQLVEIHKTKRLVFARLNMPDADEIIICGLHFPSKLESTVETQYKDARQLAADISAMQRRPDINHDRFLVYGDFNMNPYEPGMIEPDGFNAVMSTSIAQRQFRTNWYNENMFFYNPMWSFMGDRNTETGVFKQPGTYFFERSRDVNLTYWNVFDKVILRPSVIEMFDFASLRIVTHNGLNSMIDTDHRPKADYSDHLPLTFKLNI